MRYEDVRNERSSVRALSGGQTPVYLFSSVFARVGLDLQQHWGAAENSTATVTVQ